MNNTITYKKININKIKIPVVLVDKEKWYPLSYLFSKIFLRENSINKSQKEKYNVQKFNINFTELIGEGGVQETNCISETYLKEYILNMSVGHTNLEQRCNINKLNKYLKISLLPEYEDIVDYKVLGENYISKYDGFVQDCINEILNIEPNIKWKLCTGCGNYYPLHRNFFNEDRRLEDGLFKMCRCCSGSNMVHNDKLLNNIYHRRGYESFINYKESDVINVYKEYWQSNTKKIPKLLNNKESYEEIILWLLENKYITKENLSFNVLKNEFKLKGINRCYNINELYYTLFKNEPLEKPWLYPCYTMPKLTYNEGKKILNTYIHDYEINIEDVFQFDYYSLIRKAKLHQFDNDCLSFIMHFYDYKYGAYLFKGGINHWKTNENRIRALKYLIEEDMKIPLDKIPLYLTKNSLRKKSNTLYNLLHEKKYYNSLFDWVNEVYPNKFIRQDFEIGNYRNEFDSLEEEQIYNILKDNFENVIYNRKNCDNTIKFDGKIPDYIVITKNNTYIIEYFGLYVTRDSLSNNSRIMNYKERTDEKIKIYESISHEKIFLYPDDLSDNYKGVREKIMLIN